MRLPAVSAVLLCIASASFADDEPRPFATFDLAGPEELNDPHDPVKIGEPLSPSE